MQYDWLRSPRRILFARWGNSCWPFIYDYRNSENKYFQVKMNLTGVSVSYLIWRAELELRRRACYFQNDCTRGIYSFRSVIELEHMQPCQHKKASTKTEKESRHTSAVLWGACQDQVLHHQRQGWVLRSGYQQYQAIQFWINCQGYVGSSRWTDSNSELWKTINQVIHELAYSSLKKRLANLQKMLHLKYHPPYMEIS